MIFERKVKVNRDQVLRYLGYHNPDNIPAQVSIYVDQALKKTAGLIKGRVIYEEFRFTLDLENKRLLLPGGYYFSGEYLFQHLNKSSFLIIAVSTLGQDFDEISPRTCSGNDLLEVMIFDAMGNAALKDLSRRFWLELAGKYKQEGLGLTRRCSPGENGWPLQEQEVLFNLLDAGAIGVSLTESLMMKPIKSLSMVYGVTGGSEVSLVNHDCSECNLIKCPYREQ